MMFKILYSPELIVLCSLLLAAVVYSEHHGNPADDLVEIINKNRTAHKLPELSNSPGLGCVALQYAEECQANCTGDNTINCHPSADDFTEVFAPNCGVELPTFGTISGYIVGCQHKDLMPSEAFSQVLVRDKKSLSLLGNRSHHEVGIGIFRAHKHKEGSSRRKDVTVEQAILAAEEIKILKLLISTFLSCYYSLSFNTYTKRCVKEDANSSDALYTILYP